MSRGTHHQTACYHSPAAHCSAGCRGGASGLWVGLGNPGTGPALREDPVGRTKDESHTEGPAMAETYGFGELV